MLRSRAGLGLGQAACALQQRSGRREEEEEEEEEGEEERASSSHHRHHQAEEEFWERKDLPPSWSAFCLLLGKEIRDPEDRKKKGEK
jgi:hypothetical protein